AEAGRGPPGASVERFRGCALRACAAVAPARRRGAAKLQIGRGHSARCKAPRAGRGEIDEAEELIGAGYARRRGSAVVAGSGAPRVCACGPAAANWLPSREIELRLQVLRRAGLLPELRHVLLAPGELGGEEVVLGTEQDHVLGRAEPALSSILFVMELYAM